MIASRTYPKTKAELIRAIQSLINPKFKVIEVFSAADQAHVNRVMKEWKNISPYFIVLIKE